MGEIIIKKREEKNKKSRERILNASLKEFGEKDYNEASLNNICKNNNISKGLLFHYYKNKDEIFLQCVENLFNDLSNYLQNNYKVLDSNVEENIINYFEKRIEFFYKFPYYKQLFISAVLNPPKKLIGEIKALRDPIDNTNRLFLTKIIQVLDLKKDVIIEDVVEIIVHYLNSMDMKFQHENLKQVDNDNLSISKYSKEFIKMINMLLYGIVK